MPDAKLDCHFQTSQRLPVIACAIVHCSITEFPNVVQHIENPIRGRSFILKAAQNICLGFIILYIAANERSVSPCQSFPELAQLNQAGARIVLKIALREPAKFGKFAVQTVEELKITMTLIHWTIFARVITKKQLITTLRMQQLLVCSYPRTD